MMKMIRRPNYIDLVLTDDSKIKVPPRFEVRRESQQVEIYCKEKVEGVTRDIAINLVMTRMEVKSVMVNQLSAQLYEKDAKIRDLTTKLSEFERAHSFMPSKPHLPKGYFDDLVGEDELYD